MKDLNGNTIEITAIQLFIHKNLAQISEYDFEEVVTYSANIVLNDSFVAQVHGDKDEATFDGVCASSDCFWIDEAIQDTHYEEIDRDDLETWLDSQGFENNLGWLEDSNLTEKM